jgi:hypothetical protein
LCSVTEREAITMFFRANLNFQIPHIFIASFRI